jgi:hypothetical protein
MYMPTISKLNIKIADLFSDAPEVDNDFVAPNQSLPNDFVDESQSDLQRNETSKQELRDGWAERIDWDIAHGTQHGRDTDNPAQQTAPYGQMVMSSKNSVLGTVLVQDGSVVKGRVAAQGIQGTVISEGTNEFSVIWDDKVASTEEKSDYRLINRR